MSLKTNRAFLNAFIELDDACRDRYDISHHGVTDYINRLINTRAVHDRGEILPRLVRYRNIRNRMAHEADALARVKDVSSADVRWLKSFAKDVSRGKDPLSVYIRKTENRDKWQAARMIFVPILVLILGGGVFALLKFFGII